MSNLQGFHNTIGFLASCVREVFIALQVPSASFRVRRGLQYGWWTDVVTDFGLDSQPLVPVLQYLHVQQHYAEEKGHVCTTRMLYRAASWHIVKYLLASERRIRINMISINIKTRILDILPSMVLPLRCCWNGRRIISNDKPVTDGKVFPAVYLAVESALANILLNYALSEGVTVAWWVKATKPGSIILDVHNVWSYGTSVKSALFSGRNFNLAALAGLTVALIPINGPLLQRASTVSTLPIYKMNTLSVIAAQEFPPGYTDLVGFVTSNFSSVVQDYVLKKPLNLRTLALSINNGQVNTAITPGIDVFATTFTYLENSLYDQDDWYLTFNYTSLYKTSGDCWGDLNVAQLKPALLQYNDILDSDAISLGPQYIYRDDHVVQYLSTYGNNAQGSTTHGGMYLALSSLFNSSSNPTEDILAVTRELAFRTAIHTGNSSNAMNVQSVLATSVSVLTVYSSHYLYLGLVLLFTLLSAIYIVPIFMGWWALGRNVSLSPIEIAKTFNAPILGNSDPNLGAGDLLSVLGKKKVRYGAASTVPGAVYAHNGVIVGGAEKLIIGEPQRYYTNILCMVEETKVVVDPDDATYKVEEAMVVVDPGDVTYTVEDWSS
ncbi:hypothetical protein G7Y89_g262 [Cudoniella acicularis]|uniref:Uncharacterized protein n=1 Tax=Cudoniella acicularis TaxID=354080 RepID=A0A8H4RYE3_9HELO|nr:hypothetical protein G7Y89_g262 [Cudoniella acicularis]